MLRSSATAVSLLRSSFAASSSSSLPAASTALRSSSSVPEFWGKPSPYTEGTKFLGTPQDHLELTSKRPISPHVWTLDGKPGHYKMPYGALSSIANRVTGVALSVGFAGAGYVALTGDLPAALALLKADYPAMAVLAKATISFPLVYHYAGGMRHVVWDLHKIGKQTDPSLLETAAVEKSSQIMIGVSAAIAAVVALL